MADKHEIRAAFEREVERQGHDRTRVSWEMLEPMARRFFVAGWRACEAAQAAADGAGLSVDCYRVDKFVRIERRGQSQWAVCSAFGECLSKDGTWSHEPRPSNRTDDWLTLHRFGSANEAAAAWQAALSANRLHDGEQAADRRGDDDARK